MAGFLDKVQSLIQGKEDSPAADAESHTHSIGTPDSSAASSLMMPTQVSQPEAFQGKPESSSAPTSTPDPSDGKGSRSPKNSGKLPAQPLYQKWYAWTAAVILAGTGGLAATTLQTMNRMRAELPDPQDVLIFVRDGTLTIKAGDGSVLQQLGPATRSNFTLEDIPPYVIEGFLASEDNDFYEHDGVDYRAIARAMLANVRAGEVVEGASTITQQLTRLVFLDQDQTLERKLREALMAHKMEQELTKEQILERYLNLVYLGGGAYGVADAAWVYFSKSVDELTLPEIAMIVGLAPAPSEFSPLVDENAAQERRNLVLSRMEESGYITAQERAAAASAPIGLKPSTPRNLYSRFPYFTQYVRQELPKLVDPEELEAGGLTVETTLNPEWQALAQETVNQAITEYGRRQRFSQAALVTLDPRTGEIRAMVGGNDFNESQFNRVVQAQRQPGSTFKTFVYTTAIAAGLSPEKTYVDAKLVVDGYEPKNYGESFSGTQTMRNALIRSINIIAVKALIEVGFDPVIEVAQKMGIKSPLIRAYSLALGSVEVNLLELTAGYGTLANRGEYIEPHGITRVINRRGEVIYESEFATERAVDQDTADIMTWILSGVITNGTGGNARLGDRPVAGKTGTSELRRDLWFIGYIPQLATGVWLGNDDSTPTRGASSTAARVWNRFMVQIVDELPVEQFPARPRLSGRTPTIEIQRVRPARIQESNTPTERDQDGRTEAETPREQSPERTSTSPASRPSPAPEPPRPQRPEVGRSEEPDARVEPVAPPEPPTAEEPPAETRPAPEPPPAPVEAPPAAPAPAPAAPPEAVSEE